MGHDLSTKIELHEKLTPTTSHLGVVPNFPDEYDGWRLTFWDLTYFFRRYDEVSSISARKFEEIGNRIVQCNHDDKNKYVELYVSDYDFSLQSFAANIRNEIY
ncbi:hypothetical protein WA026_008851 [Henosepilachna vigintioctopunctata]|uniref:Uncharacterized protein n=1 Tax=Henosepilachna vigintioctopunctata TaxID=420089 RepID=A0AAW1VCL9_9CUCU